METVLKIKTTSLDNSIIKSLQEKYGNAALEIKVVGSHEQDWMNESLFWQLIDLLNWEEETDAEICEPLIIELSNLPVQYIYGFQDILAEKLFQLDGKTFATQFSNKKNNLSVDDFLYARCCVVANGKDAFFTVVENPELFPKDVFFEPILNIAATAYFKKTKQEFEYTPETNIETYSNELAWQ